MSDNSMEARQSSSWAIKPSLLVVESIQLSAIRLLQCLPTRLSLTMASLELQRNIFEVLSKGGTTFKEAKYIRQGDALLISL